MSVSCGVPQGTILGTLVFSIYINVLLNELEFSHVSLYVDYTVIYCYGSNPTHLIDKLNKDLLLILATGWMKISLP